MPGSYVVESSSGRGSVESPRPSGKNAKFDSVWLMTNAAIGVHRGGLPLWSPPSVRMPRRSTGILRHEKSKEMNGRGQMEEQTKRNSSQSTCLDFDRALDALVLLFEPNLKWITYAHNLLLMSSVVRSLLAHRNGFVGFGVVWFSFSTPL